MLHRALYLLGLLIFVVPGCEQPAAGPTFTRTLPEGGEAIVYHYRVDEARNSGAALDLFANGSRFARLEPRMFYTQTLAPGQYEFASRVAEPGMRRMLSESGDLTFRPVDFGMVVHVEAGTEYYLRWLVRATPQDQLEPAGTPDVVAATVIPERRESEPMRRLPEPTDVFVSAVSPERAIAEIAPLRRAP